MTTQTMSYDEFLVADFTHAEWVNGEVIIPMPPRLIHQLMLGFLVELLRVYVRMFDLGKVYQSPFEMKLSNSAREPDVFFIAKENLNRLSDKRIDGPADLVIEVVSKDSVKRDRDSKFREYEAAGVREYWIIDPRPERKRADFYARNDAGVYALLATEEDERMDSTVLHGFWMHPAWLWEADTRDPLLTFCEIAGWPESLVQQIKAQIETSRQSNKG